MLCTPSNFVSLLIAQSHTAPLNLVFYGDALLVADGDLSLPDNLALAHLLITPERCLPVGLLDGRYCQTTWIGPAHSLLEGYAFRRLRSLFGAIDDTLLAVAGRAYQIAEWARTHRYCGVCATATVQINGERCLRCPACGHAAYPRISPAMMVLVKKGDSLLLARHTNSPTGYFTALAGFLEAGE
ncbi:MAG: NADH pyrophosphatase, partial [Rhodoferax sp.]|nr:NADH pyrophosphatase [Rhodoferax sp.]